MINKTRSQRLSDLRPQLDLERDPVSEAEKFQNRVLRPIIKFQHELLMALFRQYLHKRKARFDRMQNEEKLAYITQAVQKDRSFRNLLIGTIIGHFSVSEWEEYTAQEAELTRRTGNLLIQRIQSQVQHF